MMRDIKFRAFSGSIMRYEVSTSFDKGEGCKPVRKGYQWFSKWNDVYDSNLMQYTGLKDKHGVEIYEGDIISFYIEKSRGYFKLEETLLIEYRDCNFVATGITDKNINYWLGHPRLSEIEVIGNIYENKDLL